MDYEIYVMLLLTLAGYSESLECHSCSNVANTGGCNVTTLCSDHQSCFLNLTSGEHTLGCVDNKKCDSHATVSAIVGRDLVSKITPTCFECCSVDHCNSALCRHPELDGNRTLWTSWSTCDVTCENGHQTRTRTCTNPAPKNGGLDCAGGSMMTKNCNITSPCPVHGGWSNWSQWGTCSVTCDVGLQRRTRTCSNPPPSLTGNHCFGDSTETQLCMPGPCANGGWSDWTSWSTCSASCGGGIRSQSRSCSNPKPSPYGQYCVGSNDRVESCANNICETKHCETNPCHHGQCFEFHNDFLCVCNHGYEGRYCNMSNYYCKTSPCNYGTCVPGISDYTCNCFEGYTGKHCNLANVTDCFDILHRNLGRKNGIHKVTLWKSLIVKEIYCDMETDNGGWTVFQNRFDGSVNFTRTMQEYTNGFGSYSGEYWLGLKYIEEMASQGVTELRIDLTAADNSSVYEVFQNFSLGTYPGYELHIDNGTGTAGDTNGLSYNNGQPFYTYDHDNTYRCVRSNHGGWWYNFCSHVNLNGEYLIPGISHNEEGMIYYDFKAYGSLKKSRMMFRRM